MPTMRAIFLQAFSSGKRQWRIAAIVYAVQLCLVLTLGMQVYEVLKASIGHSLEINKLLLHYDHTVIADFLKVHGASITPLIGQLRWLLLVWLLFSVFLNGGMLVCATTMEKPSGRDFWTAGATYFFPFLKISLLFLLFVLLWSVLILLPIALYLEPALEYFSTEQYPIWIVLLLLAGYLKGLAWLYMWSVAARLNKICENNTIFKCLGKGWKTLWKNKWRFGGFMAGFVLIQFLLLVFYWQLEGHTGMVSPLLILVLFVVQQAVVFGRILIRGMMYRGMGLCG
jgi:hypothetical protein